MIEGYPRAKKVQPKKVNFLIIPLIMLIPLEESPPLKKSRELFLLCLLSCLDHVLAIESGKGHFVRNFSKFCQAFYKL